MDDICTLLFVVNSKPALCIGLNVFWKLFPTVNWLSGWSFDASGLGGVVNICDVLRRYKCDDGDVVLARDSVNGVVDVGLFSSTDLFCWSSSKSCELESTSAKEEKKSLFYFYYKYEWMNDKVITYLWRLLRQ